VVDLVLEWRQLSKLKSTYVDALPLLCDEDGRVHTSFKPGGWQRPAGCRRRIPTCRTSPCGTEWGQRIRRAFVAGPGRLLVSADLLQVELRVLAHVAGEEGDRGLRRARTSIAAPPLTVLRHRPEA